MPFADTDRAVEERVGCSVAELFDREGESRFRELESETLTALLGVGLGVIATGGGIVLSAANREWLRREATVVYLQTSPELLAGRLRHDTRRPLLRGGDVSERLRRLQDERGPFYVEVATHVVEAEGSTMSCLVDRIRDVLAPVTPAAPLSPT